MEAVMRNFFLFFGKNKVANKLAKKYGLHLGASKFVAGSQIKEAISSVNELNKDGRIATLDHLGEFVNSEQDANESANMCIRTLDAIYESGVNSNLSLKMTSLGLDINKDLCMNNMRRILETAKQYDNFVRIDMEDYEHCQISLDIYKELKKEFANVGIVIQAYLYRAHEDIEALNEYKANLRLVKGAYKESPKVAYPDKKDVDDNYLKLIKQHIVNGNYTAVASHDEKIIEKTKKFVKESNVSNDKFEFQMLYGICDDLQKKLVGEGYRVRVYVPYGEDWFGYFMRRLAERPANVWFVLKNMFK
jgi:proline dehydrogenase